MSVYIDVILSPDEVHSARGEFKIDFSNKLAVVVDILRATTTITTALANGAEVVLPVREIEEAFRKTKENPHALLCGERNGLIIEGFHMGNSPREYTPEKVGGRRLIFCTTNGTRALTSVSDAVKVLLACFNNALATVEWIANEKELPPAGVAILCSGKLGRFCVEDAVGCGFLVVELAKTLTRKGEQVELSEGAETAGKLFGNYGQDIIAMLKNCRHGRYLSSLGLSADLDYAGQINSHRAVVAFSDGNAKLI